ncbi:MAG TPA: ATP synthase F1 subunit epsilon [Buchnera sp. (in: enterobacteria)]|nr:ATP synthase F1 subunit epsilon [Buchnera sp. (in: enterobacteria)]
MNVQLNIVSIEKNIFSGLVRKMQISGSQGELGIYPGHSPFLTSIKPGILYFICESGIKELFYISGGILEVQPTVITVLAETILNSVALNHKCILETKKHIEKNINNNLSHAQYQKYTRKLSESLAQLRVIEMMKVLK